MNDEHLNTPSDSDFELETEIRRYLREKLKGFSAASPIYFHMEIAADVLGQAPMMLDAVTKEDFWKCVGDDFSVYDAARKGGQPTCS